MKTHPVSGPLRFAVVLLLGEAVGIGSLGTWLLVGTISEGGEGFAVGLSSAVFVVLMAVGVAILVVGVLRARAWVRAPVALTQFLVLPIGWEFLSEPTTPAGMTAVATSITILVLIFLPSSSRAFQPDGGGIGAEQPD